MLWLLVLFFIEKDTGNAKKYVSDNFNMFVSGFFSTVRSANATWYTMLIIFNIVEVFLVTLW